MWPGAWPRGTTGRAPTFLTPMIHSPPQWLTKWLTTQVKTGGSNSGTICLNTQWNQAQSPRRPPPRRSIPTLASQIQKSHLIPCDNFAQEGEGGREGVMKGSVMKGSVNSIVKGSVNSIDNFCWRRQADDHGAQVENRVSGRDLPRDESG